MSFSFGKLFKLENPQAGSYIEIDKIRGVPTEPINHQDLKSRYRDFSQGRRVAPRYGIDLDVIVFNTATSFRTKSINLSASGALLEQDLPEGFTEKSIDVVLVDSSSGIKKYMMFRAVAVGGPKKTPRLTFLKAGIHSQEKLQEILNDLTPLAEFSKTS